MPDQGAPVELWSTQQAAAHTGVTPVRWRGIAREARARGVELRADRALWPDGRTVRWDAVGVRGWVAARPGRGVGGGRPRKSAATPDG